MVAIALAGSLFFDISLHAARPHVLLGLVLTFVPFVVIAPAIGPILDSVHGMRRAMILISAIGRAILCFLMASDLKSLLLFPESFGLLVLSKVYGISKQSLVPEIASLDNKDHEAFLHANSTLNFYGAISGFIGSAVAIAIWKFPGLGSPWVLRVDSLIFIVAGLCGLRVPRAKVAKGDPLGRVDPKFGDKYTISLHDTDPYGSVDVRDIKSKPSLAGSKDISRKKIAKVPEQGPEIRISHRPIKNRIARQRMEKLFSAASAIAVMRCVVGFLEFLLIFTLRRDHYSIYWFGIVVVSLTVGSVLSNLVAPQVKKRILEEQILPAALSAIAIINILALLVPGILVEALVMLTTALSTGVAKIAFDALVQRDTPEERRGTSFARFETRFQLVWVIGAIIPVAFNVPLSWGNISMALLTICACTAYVVRVHLANRSSNR